MSVIQLGTATAAAGEKVWGQLLVREGNKEVLLPVVAINGAAPGKHVVVMANQHGAEINGVESIRQFSDAIDPARMHGTIFAIPSANPRAAMLLNECWPEDDDPGLVAKVKGCPYLRPGEDRHNCRYNMNRKWPGHLGGLLVERMTYELWNQAILAPHRRASFVMDLHCHQVPSAIYADTSEDVELGIISGIRTVIHTRSGGSGRMYCNTACEMAGIRCMTVELGGQAVLDPVSIADGHRAISNMLKFWGILGGRPEYPHPETLVLDPWRNDVLKERTWRTPSWLKGQAGHAGLVRFCKEPFDVVRKGEVICMITDPFTGRLTEPCRAPMGGVMINKRITRPVCDKGQDLFAISLLSRRASPMDTFRRFSPEMFRLEPESVKA